MITTKMAIIIAVVSGVAGFIIGILTITMILTAIAWTHKW